MQLFSVRRVLLSSCALVLPLSAQAQALEETTPAQDAEVSSVEAEPKDADKVYDAIVVVAQRREENLLDVPSSIAAVDSAQLEATSSQRVQDVANYVPNVDIASTSALGATLTIRGVGSSSRNIGFDSRAGLYIDGVYLGQSPALDQDLLGLERVEVLRGPQGTLFGKNNDAGAINLITKRPGKTFTGEAFARIGNLGQEQYAFRVSGPVTETVSASLAASSVKRDGYIRNITDGAETPSRDSQSVRGQINIDDGGPFTLYLSADALFANDRPNNGDPLTNSFGSALDTAAPERNVISYTPGRIKDDDRTIWGVSAEASYELPSNHILKSITAYRETEFSTSFDADRSALDLLNVNYEDNYQQTSEELQLISPDDGRFTYLVGLYLYSQDSDTKRDALGGALGGALGLAPGTGALSGGELKTENAAIYGNVAYDILPKLEASLGLRWSWEKKTVDWSIDGSAAPAFGIATGTVDDDRVDRDVSPTLTLTYRITPEVNTYARYSTGYKSGGYNLDFISASIFPDGVEFRKETVDNYEVGLKGAFFNNRATLNLSAFTADYTDYQVNQYRELGGGQTVIAISNAGSVRSRGIEAEGMFHVNDDLRIQGGIGLLDTTFTDFPGGGAGGVNVAGNRLPRASKFQGTIGLDYDRQISQELSLFAAAQYSYRSNYYVEENNLSTRTVGGDVISWGKVPGYGLLDARIGVAGSKGWELALYSRNLTDEDYVVSYGREFLGALLEYRGEPMSWGAEARIRF
ncbi:hypothetical protein HY29_11550 [Hyphomonas beringensis]|uniref:TonB-dependent receptor n=1 Tax=Hyphomonas beringensis TaxID=1280946 RepID=A0A062UCU5_9PROT|nr:TonB-dependent receptor [Hyphomonas beringensis]KCZ55543.1 hypothetical protein HY29_11550 [Hyphomonas beringensis]